MPSTTLDSPGPTTAPLTASTSDSRLCRTASTKTPLLPPPIPTIDFPYIVSVTLIRSLHRLRLSSPLIWTLIVASSLPISVPRSPLRDLVETGLPKVVCPAAYLFIYSLAQARCCSHPLSSIATLISKPWLQLLICEVLLAVLCYCMTLSWALNTHYSYSSSHVAHFAAAQRLAAL